jgi:hypothetical protein
VWKRNATRREKNLLVTRSGEGHVVAGDDRRRDHPAPVPEGIRIQLRMTGNDVVPQQDQVPRDPAILDADARE